MQSSILSLRIAASNPACGSDGQRFAQLADQALVAGCPDQAVRFIRLAYATFDAAPSAATNALLEYNLPAGA